MQFLRVFFVTGTRIIHPVTPVTSFTRNIFEDHLLLNGGEPTLVFNPMKSFIRPMEISGAVVRHPITARSSLRRMRTDGGDRGLKSTYQGWYQHIVSRVLQDIESSIGYKSVRRARYQEIYILLINKIINYRTFCVVLQIFL